MCVCTYSREECSWLIGCTVRASVVRGARYVMALCLQRRKAVGSVPGMQPLFT